MAYFTLKIAGHTAAVTSLFASTPDFLGKYKTDAAPSFFITVTEADIETEQRLWDEEAAEEGFRPRKFSPQFLERAVIQRKFAGTLFDRGILLFHGSTVAVDGTAFLFTGQSGTGKSTHTRLWREVFGQWAVMINDDKPFLTISEQGVFASGSPWSGKHGLDTDITLPLGGICILRRGGENRIAPLSPEQALPELERQGCRPLGPGKEDAYNGLIQTLARRVPVWQMECTKSRDAALTAYNAMSKHA